MGWENDIFNEKQSIPQNPEDHLNQSLKFHDCKQPDDGVTKYLSKEAYGIEVHAPQSSSQRISESQTPGYKQKMENQQIAQKQRKKRKQSLHHNMPKKIADIVTNFVQIPGNLKEQGWSSTRKLWEQFRNIMKANKKKANKKGAKGKRIKGQAIRGERKIRKQPKGKTTNIRTKTFLKQFLIKQISIATLKQYGFNINDDWLKQQQLQDCQKRIRQQVIKQLTDENIDPLVEKTNTLKTEVLKQDLKTFIKEIIDRQLREVRIKQN